MLIINNHIVFKTGDEHAFEFDVTEANNSLSENTKVTFAIENESGTASTDAIIEEVSIPVGTFTDPEWIIGNMINETHTGSFKITIQNDSVEYVKVILTASTTSNEVTLENNIGEFIWTGLSFDQFSAAMYENTFEVPTSAFADDAKPTNAELQSWITANISTADQVNGTILTYNKLPYSESNVYDDISIVFTKVGTVGDSMDNIVINGTPYSQPGGFDTETTALFDEAAVTTFIDAALVTEGATGTVLVTDNIDGSNNVTVTITTQTGITSIKIVADDASEYTTTIPTFTVLSNGGRKSPSHTWVLNDDGTGSTTNISYVAPDDGKVLYYSATGNDDTAEIGDSSKHYHTLLNALREAPPGYLVKIMLTGDDTVNITGEDLRGKQIEIISETFVIGTIVTIANDNLIDTDTFITISGDYKCDGGFTPIALDATITDKIFIRNAMLINDGTVADISTGAATNVIIKNVATNVLIGVADPDISELGEAILRSADYNI